MKLHTPLRLISIFLMININMMSFGQQSKDSTLIKSQSSGFKGFIERRQERLNKSFERQKTAQVEEERLNTGLNKSISAGLELENASTHLSYGLVLPIISAIAGYLISNNNDNKNVGIGIAVGGSLIGLSFTVSGFTKIGKAGRILRTRDL